MLKPARHRTPTQRPTSPTTTDCAGRPMSGRQQTAPPRPRRSKDATAHPHQPGARPDPPRPAPVRSATAQPKPRSGQGQKQNFLPHRSRRRRSSACAACSTVPVDPGFGSCSRHRPDNAPPARTCASHTEGFLASLPKLFPSDIETPLLRACSYNAYPSGI
jgi:hypothetical protein